MRTSLSKSIAGSLAALALGVSVATTPVLAHGGGGGFRMGGGGFHGGFGGYYGYYAGYGYCDYGYGYYGYGNCFPY